MSFDRQNENMAKLLHLMSCITDTAILIKRYCKEKHLKNY